MEIVFSPEAESDLMFWKHAGNKKVQAKIEALLDSIEATPFEGIGKPEPLKHQLSGYWSGRITPEHRLVYKVESDKIIITQLRKHSSAPWENKTAPHL